ncbi:transposase [Cohnella lupini]|uniref:Uncharacterized protein n=1 Tax=Cohnella lupini TaxID=1294267 RepID=A0A3D9HQY7_9BACL|nr:transposase [Cohnella lupini]RED51927.1 hypothetical protein DFP95_1356 [Cohnella lupini]
MKILIVAGSIVVPLIMVMLRKYWVKSQTVFNALSILSALVFGNIAAISVQEIIEDHTVFMTNIHEVFLNPYFLSTGAYIGVYLLYRLLLISMEEI